LNDVDEDPRLGRTVGARYRIVRRIGEGGMGVVYEAEDTRDARRVALKCVHAHLASHRDVLARFEREAKAATAVGNEHIVEVLDTGRLDDGSAFMVLEYLSGSDLASEIADGGPLTIGRATHVATQIADALYVAHGMGVIHRDLKPENIFLVDPRGRDFVKVLDFGISKIREAEGGQVTALTRTGTTVGTPYYMAPEQAQGHKDVDHRVDVYALGVILFRALTGQHPFDDESYPMLVLKICTEAPPPVQRYRPDVPLELAAVIEKMLAKDPADRHRSMRDVGEALGPFRELRDPPVLTGAPGTRATRASALGGGARVDSPLARAETVAATRVAGAVSTAGAAGAGGWQSGPGLPIAGSPVLPGSSSAPDPADEEVVIPGAPRAGRSQNAVLWLLLAVGIAALAGMALLVFTSERDEPIEQEAELPEPAPPRTKALVAPAGSGIGWSWVNPMPRAMPTWYDVDVAASELVAMVGFAGEAARFQQGTMFRWRTGTDVSLFGVAWTGAREAIAVGDEGELRVLRLEGEAQRIDSGTTEALRSIVATSPTEAWVTGDAGTLLRLAAYEAHRVETATDRDLLAAHLRGQALFVVGEAGTILRVEGDTITSETSGTEATLRAIGGCNDGDLYAVGDEGRVLRRRADGRWEILQHDLREPWAGLACDRAHGRAVAVGLRGGVLLIAGKRVVRLASGTDRSLHEVGSAHGSATWVVGDGGRLMKVMDDHVVTLTSGPTSSIQDVGALGGALVAVGEWGRILREQRNGVVEGRSPTKAALASVAPLGEDRLLAAGDYGAIVTIRYDTAELVESPSGHSWRDLVSDGQIVLGVGTDGGILRGTPGAFDVSRVPRAGTLWAVSGTPSDAIAVGDEGVVVALAERGMQRISCGVDVSLRGVSKTPAGTWIVGDEGVILRLDGRRCVAERAPTAGAPTLNGIGIGPYGRPIAVGNRGTALERTEAGTWSPIDVDVGRNNLRGIYRGDRDVFIVGAGGVILRHVRLD
jgi:serine/threonine-protein kinase